MAKYLLVCGHGQGDPGAIGNGICERDWTRNPLSIAIKKHASKLKKNSIDIYDTSKDMFQQSKAGQGAYTVSNSYASVTEIHLDAASASATGGHVIISSSFNPDSYDLKIAEVVKKYAGWWGSVKNTKGINKRNNLLNLNVFAKRGISYRLIELGFITSKHDTDILKSKYDSLAKDLVEAITGESISSSNGSNSNNGNNSNTPGKNTKPLTNGKVGDTVKIFDALYKDSDGKGRSTKMRGKTGVIKKIANGKGKKYLIESWGWAHPNDLQLVKSGSSSAGYPAKKVGQTVTVQSWATTYQTGQKIASFVRGKSYKIKQIKSVNQSKSKRAYLLDGINSWVLEQDVK